MLSVTAKRRVVTRTRLLQNAASKAPNDVREICRRMGLDTVDLAINGGSAEKALSAVRASSRLLVASGSRESGDGMVVQYPLGFPLDGLMRLTARAGRRVAFVHDIETLRGDTSPDLDIRNLRRYDAIISPTTAMTDWLRTLLLDGPPIYTLGMYDYLLSDDIDLPSPDSRPSNLYFVGQLGKAQFLYTLRDTAAPLVVFGPNCVPEKLPAHVTWRGVLDMERPRLPALDGFGLLWDGESGDQLAGAFGRYLAYNAPHKLSFYIASGLPVIVPPHSAVADLVLEAGVGLTASSVYEAAEQVRGCGEARWRDLCAATARLRSKVIEGGHTSEAVAKALGVY